jgi:hypothetical protein
MNSITLFPLDGGGVRDGGARAAMEGREPFGADRGLTVEGGGSTPTPDLSPIEGERR